MSTALAILFHPGRLIDRIFVPEDPITGPLSLAHPQNAAQPTIRRRFVLRRSGR